MASLHTTTYCYPFQIHHFPAQLWIVIKLPWDDLTIVSQRKVAFSHPVLLCLHLLFTQ